MDGQSPSVGDFSQEDAIRTYQQLITQLPPLNRQLLLYILDLLAVFASKSDLNKMTTPNLAAIFQPGILSHPSHDMAPSEYRLSQDVLIFLIENQDHFLIGMQGTAADAKTVAEVESGPPTPQNRSSTPRHSKSTVVRSGSNSSRYSGIRRSVSASSRRSRNSVPSATAPSPVGSDFHTPLANPPSAGVHRSNTLPHTRSPILTPGRLGREKEGNRTPESIQEHQGADSSGIVADKTPVQPPPKKKHLQPAMHEMLSPVDNDVSPLPNSTQLAHGIQSIPEVQVPSNQPQQMNRTAPGQLNLGPSNLQSSSEQTTPTGTQKFVATLFGAKSPPADAKRPNKLQKRRTGGSTNPSAHSSTHSLSEPVDIDPSHISIQNSLASNAPLLTPRKENIQGPLWHDDAPLQTPPPIGGLKPNMSPAASYGSHSDIDNTDPEHLNLQSEDNTPEGKQRRHWFSRGERKGELSPPQPGTVTLGSNGLAQTSRSSVLSGGDASAGRKSVTLDRSQQTSEGVTSDSEREPRKEKNPINWIKGKVRDFHDKMEERDRIREEKRVASPTRLPGSDRSSSNTASATDGPTSIDTITSGTNALPRSTDPQRRTDQQLMPPPPAPTTQSQSVWRGKSLDMPRSTPAPGPTGRQRQSQDVQRTTPPPQVTAAKGIPATSAAPHREPNGQRNEQPAITMTYPSPPVDSTAKS
jgi:GTPase-activating protein SAC7